MTEATKKRKATPTKKKQPAQKTETPKKEKQPDKAELALKTANEAAAKLRRVVKKLEQVFGMDIDGDGKAGFFKPTALIGVCIFAVLITIGGWAANELVLRFCL